MRSPQVRMLSSISASSMFIWKVSNSKPKLIRANPLNQIQSLGNIVDQRGFIAVDRFERQPDPQRLRGRAAFRERFDQPVHRLALARHPA